jgi:hypothetical protein
VESRKCKFASWLDIESLIVISQLRNKALFLPYRYQLCQVDACLPVNWIVAAGATIVKVLSPSELGSQMFFLD